MFNVVCFDWHVFLQCVHMAEIRPLWQSLCCIFIHIMCIHAHTHIRRTHAAPCEWKSSAVWVWRMARVFLSVSYCALFFSFPCISKTSATPKKKNVSYNRKEKKKHPVDESKSQGSDAAHQSQPEIFIFWNNFGTFNSLWLIQAHQLGLDHICREAKLLQEDFKIFHSGVRYKNKKKK